MKTIKFGQKTGWKAIPADTQTIVAHLKNGQRIKMSLVDFLTLPNRKNITEVDLYKANELIKED